MAYLETISLSQSPANFLTCRARILLGQWVSFGFQASCKIHQTFSCLHSFSAAIISYTVHFSQTLDVCNLVKAEDGVKCEWTASVSLGSLALFPRCCTVDLLCVGFTVFLFYFFFLWGRGDICYNIVMIIWTVNCTAFTIVVCFLLGIHIKSYSLIIFSFFCFVFVLFFSPDCGKSNCTAPEFILLPRHCFFYFLEPMIKRNLKTVNKYYCAEIWMSLQKCIWMS